MKREKKQDPRCSGKNLGEQVKAEILAVNEPRTLKVIVPADLEPGTAYTLAIVTQTPVKGGGTLLKELRKTRSEFTLTAQP